MNKELKNYKESHEILRTELFKQSGVAGDQYKDKIIELERANQALMMMLDRVRQDEIDLKNKNLKNLRELEHEIAHLTRLLTFFTTVENSEIESPERV